MARGDGIHRVNVRNVNLTDKEIGNAQKHNEREKDSYRNEDIVIERSEWNVHYKDPAGDYDKVFDQMVSDRLISTRGLKADAVKYGELVFDVNSAYFYNHGGYEFAKQFYEDAYKAAVEIVGGEQYILSAVMHADEKNQAMSEKLGEDVYHYHLHVVYIPVVEKQVLWSKRCKDKSLIGTVKETIMQVSHSKKWISKPAIDEKGDPILQKNGKPVLRKSYSVLQDDFFHYMRNAGYMDVERGEKGSDEEHLTVTQFKVQKEQERLIELQHQSQIQQQLMEQLQEQSSELTEGIADLQQENEELQKKTGAKKKEFNRIRSNLDAVEAYASEYSRDPEEWLPEPKTIESAKAYRNRIIPILRKLCDKLKAIYAKYIALRDENKKLNAEIDRLENISDRRQGTINFLRNENEELREKANNFDRVRSVVGDTALDQLIAEVKMREEAERQTKRMSRNKKYEIDL